MSHALTRLSWAILVSNANSGYKHLLELHNFYKLNVSHVTTYIIRSDYYSVTDKFKFKNTTVRNVKFIKVMQFKANVCNRCFRFIPIKDYLSKEILKRTRIASC